MIERTLPILGILMALLSASPAAFPAEIQFEKDVLPILQNKCVRCHGGNAVEGNLDVRSLPLLLEGGRSGPAVSPGSPERSLVWIKTAADKMPQDKEKLTEAEKVTLRAWIEGGARGTAVVSDAPEKPIADADRNFWAFRKPVRKPIPEVRRTEQVRTPIDAFLLAALENKGLTFSREAERTTLVRRLFFDLIGLPPSPEELDQVLTDPAPDAYERLVERLLSSPHHGERWGRHWLDAAGYADSEGILDADYVRTAAWRYRDYVIRAFNADKPYSRFLQEQIAGDELTDYWTAVKTRKELPAEVVEGLVATGYLRCASDTSRPDFASIKNAPGYYFQTLDDTIRILSSSTMGLTMHCARCHTHKYDPIPQSEYFRMQAIFMSAYRPAQWVPQVQRRLLEATEEQEKAARDHNARIDAEFARLTKEGEQEVKEFGQRLFQDRLTKLPEQIREDVKIALDTEAPKRTEVQKYLAEKFQKELRPDPKTLPQLLAQTYPDFATRQKQRTAKIQAENVGKINFPEIRAAYDLPGEPKTHILRRGDYLNPAQLVTPGVPTVLTTRQPFTWQAPLPESKTSRRRLAFAEWLTQPDHPLTSRVLVNRLWMHHFGEGIVSTIDNFGRTGSAPSHPELLDWLAVEFVESGWSIKHMHRLIVTSSAYRQSSSTTEEQREARRLDPENKLLRRQRLRRLEAEPLRDAMLFSAGILSTQMYGPPTGMVRQGDGEVVVPGDPSGRRRSIYLQVRRSQPLTMLQIFDQPVMETNCTRRGTSTVTSQALSLLNSETMTQLASAFAARVLRESPEDPVTRALSIAFARPPSEREKTRLHGFLTEQGQRHLAALTAGKPASEDQKQQANRRALEDLCHMLLAANETAYVD